MQSSILHTVMPCGSQIHRGCVAPSRLTVDVGLIRGGRFHRLFHALLSSFRGPSISQVRRTRILIPKLSDHIIYGTLSPSGHYYSDGVDMAALEPDIQVFG